MTHFRILLGSAFHMNGPLYAYELLKISTLAYGNVTKLVDVEFLVSLIATSLQIVMQSEVYAMPRIHLNTVSVTK